MMCTDYSGHTPRLGDELADMRQPEKCIRRRTEGQSNRVDLQTGIQLHSQG